jgi:hypothetical protein
MILETDDRSPGGSAAVGSIESHAGATYPWLRAPRSSLPSDYLAVAAMRMATPVTLPTTSASRG